DMKLRNGNNEKNEHIIQASLLGTDISTEGPFSKKHKSSYLFNFRYSTIGMLSAIGVNFGDEKISYGDFSYVMSFPYKRGVIKAFGVIGSSQNIFDGKADSVTAETEKDFKNIDYRSLTNVSGISMVNSLGNSAYFKTVIAYSVKQVLRESEPALAGVPLTSDVDRFSQQKISTLNYLSNRLGQQFRLKTGAYVNYFMHDIHSSVNGVSTVKAGISEPLIQPFVSLEGTVLNDFELEAGLHGFYQERTNYFMLQPRVQLKYNFSEQQCISANYGTSAQLQPAQLYVIGDQLSPLLPTTSTAYSLIHRLRLKFIGFKTELFYQEFQNIPVNTFNGFSAFNYFNEIPPTPLTSNGTGKSYGADFTSDITVKEFYLILSASVYNSIYKLPGAEEKAGRFNTNYNLVATAGKEFRLVRGNKFISFNLRGMTRNGFLEPNNTAAINQFSYVTPLEQYYRFDLRMSYRKNRLNSSYIWALDIQNVTARKNEAYHYYDSFTGKVETKYQLGFIPVLSFKVLF
ncbi:MAG: TonB-dependent receptor plug, partial [Bacteroidetes bacterium]|nr:TonB-dependent receptor plug [Bacteroidota bacterium]